jgi:DNA invertase Pin-like site-specific DNA recombinase
MKLTQQDAQRIDADRKAREDRWQAIYDRWLIYRHEVMSVARTADEIGCSVQTVLKVISFLKTTKD